MLQLPSSPVLSSQAREFIQCPTRVLHILQKLVPPSAVSRIFILFPPSPCMTFDTEHFLKKREKSRRRKLDWVGLGWFGLGLFFWFSFFSCLACLLSAELLQAIFSCLEMASSPASCHQAHRELGEIGRRRAVVRSDKS